MGLQGSLEISALFVAADLVNSGTGTVWKNERVLASVAVLGKVLRNVNYDGETWSNDIQRLEEGIDGLQGQIVQTNAELDKANQKIADNTAGLSRAQSAIVGLENRTNTLEQDVADLKRDITGVYQFKGSVNTYADLLTKSATAEIGDVWEVIHPDGINYAWVGKTLNIQTVGTAWDRFSNSPLRLTLLSAALFQTATLWKSTKRALSNRGRRLTQKQA